MKKLIYIVTLASLLCACSAEKRLAHLLAYHPELKSTQTITVHDTIIITDTIIIPSDSNTLALTLQDIVRMDSLASSSEKQTTESQNVAKQTVETPVSGAALQAHGNGKFTLSAYTKPDTVYIHDTIPNEQNFDIPQYTTKTEYKEVIVYEQYWYQKAFMWWGIIITIIIIIAIIIRFVI